MSTFPAARPRARPGGGTRGGGGSRRPQARRGLSDSGKLRIERHGPQLHLTSRMAIVIVVLALLMAGFASSVRGYLSQRERITALKADITAEEATVADLQEQTDRWDDPVYVAQQARQRFGYVMPGQMSFVAVNGDGTPVTPTGELSDPHSIGKESMPTLWYDKIWASVETAAEVPDTDASADTSAQ